MKEIRFKKGPVQEMGKRAEEVPQARFGSQGGTWYAGDEHKFQPKKAGAVSQNLMPVLTALAVGAGGGGLGGTYLKDGISPAQLQTHTERINDKIDRAVDRLEDKIEDLEDKLDDAEKRLRELLDHMVIPMDEDTHIGNPDANEAKEHWNP